MLKKIMLPALLVMGMSAHADEDSVKGLIGVGAGYIGTEYNEEGSGGDSSDTVGAPSFNLKLGAEGRFYRAFIDGSFWYTDEYHSAGTLGVALQYLIRPAEAFNIFLGVNGGYINTIGDTEGDAYYGVDAGVNLDLSENFGIEVGGRAAGVSGGNSDYAATAFYQGYANLIFKFTGDY
ncbi:MAG: hypothetical protein P8Y65_04240 [Campylobacterales bacterium]|jgi:hypothetical protein